MLKELGEYFDHYTINARFMPAFFSLLPLVLTVLAWFPSSKSLLGGSITILISFGVMTFISTFISNLGINYQKRLFVIWGGDPTTIILRHSDQSLDKYTKQRYHSWLDQKINGLDLPKFDDEVADPADADFKYQSAINFLREFTRDKTKHPAIYRDNVAYGFSRNLLAIRKFGLLISSVCVLINLYMLWSIFGHSPSESNAFISNNYSLGVVAGFASVIFMITFLFVTNNIFVMERGFRYAKTLLETCEEPE